MKVTRLILVTLQLMKCVMKCVFILVPQLLTFDVHEHVSKEYIMATWHIEDPDCMCTSMTIASYTDDNTANITVTLYDLAQGFHIFQFSEFLPCENYTFYPTINCSREIIGDRTTFPPNVPGNVRNKVVYIVQR